MNDQRRLNSLSPLDSNFDRFLFAPVSEDHDGMLLSVNSALARLNLDPWDEAAELVRLPKEVATRRLATLIATLPNSPSTQYDSETMAQRLIALLPRQVAAVFPTGTVLDTARSVVGSESSLYMVLFAIFIVSMVGIQWLFGLL